MTLYVNQNGADGFTLEIVVYSQTPKQARYLVHGIDDTLWTNDIDAVLDYLKIELERIIADESGFGAAHRLL